MNAIALTISDVLVRQDDSGRYCLNDLHKAAGGEKRHQPSDWLRIQQTQELIAEVEIPGFPGIVSKQGLGTFAVKELVYAYAMWISAKFHVAVIRAYDALVTGRLFENTVQLPEPPTITKSQQGILFNLVAGKSDSSGKPRAYYWSRFANHFKLSSYKDCPADKFDEAHDYLRGLEGEEMLYLTHSEIEEKAKAIAGELLDKPEQNAIAIDLNMPEGVKQLTLSFNSKPVFGKRWFMFYSGDNLVIQPLNEDEFMTKSEKLPRIIEDSMGGCVSYQHLPSIIEAAAKRMKLAQIGNHSCNGGVR